MSRLLAGLAGLAAAVVVLLLPAPPATAHGPASTLVRVSLAAPPTATSGPTVRLVAKVALQELDVAYDTDLMDEAARTDPAGTVDRHAEELRELFLGRVVLETPDGTPWSVAVDDLAAGTDQGQDAVRVVLLATGPAGGDTDSVALTWGVVTDVVVTHDVYVGAVAADGTTSLVATLTRADPTTTLEVDAPASATPDALWRVGFDHFREGPDHLLFLSLVTLGAARRRAGWVRTARRLGVLTLTFTAGHSASLALATLGWVSLPSRWVEVGIAATIVLAAAHAVRPRLPARAEVAVTGAFGLVHGFGFAGTLAELSLHGRDLVVPLLTFNLGLEAAQLAALALVIVPLLVLARSARATRVLALAVGLVAVSWVVERAAATRNPLEPVVDALLASPERWALLLAVAAGATAALTAYGGERVAALPAPERDVERSGVA